MNSEQTSPTIGYSDGRFVSSAGQPSPDDRRLTRRERRLTGRDPIEHELDKKSRTISRARSSSRSSGAGPRTPCSISSQISSLEWDGAYVSPTYSSTRRLDADLANLALESTFDIPPKPSCSSTNSLTGLHGITLLDRALKQRLVDSNEKAAKGRAGTELDDSVFEPDGASSPTPTPSTLAGTGSEDTIIEVQQRPEPVDTSSDKANSTTDQFVEAKSDKTDSSAEHFTEAETDKTGSSADKTAEVEAGQGDPLNEQIETTSEQELIMPDDLVNRHRAVLSGLALVIEDDIESTDPRAVMPDYLAEKVKLAEDWKVKAREAIVYLEQHDADVYNEKYATAAASGRKKLVEFIKLAQLVLKESRDAEQTQRHSAVAAQAATRVIKANSVLKYSEQAVNDMQLLIDSMEELALNDPSSDNEYRKHEADCAAMTKKVNAVKDDSRSLYSAAVEAGLSDEAEDLEKHLRLLKDKAANLDEHLLANKQKFGMAERGGSGGARYASDLTPPVFKGDFSAKEDFYIWSADFEEYSKVKMLTRDEKLRILVTKSLDGDAKLACQHMKSSEDIFSYLRSTYGNVRMLLDRQLKTIKDLGRCEGNDDSQRRWCLNVRAKLQYVESLASQHGLLEHLYNSVIIDETRSKLPYKLQDRYVDKMREVSGGGLLDRGKMFSELSQMLHEHCEMLAFKINNGMSFNNKTADKKANPEVSSKNKPQAKAGAQKRGYAVQAADGEQDKPRRGGDGKGAGGRKKDKDSSDGGKGKGSTAGAASHVVKEAQCRICPGSHTYLYYCEEYRKVDIDERYKLVKNAKVCHRCLAVETEVDFGNRAKWWEDHAPNCHTPWPCKVGGCKKKPPKSQYNATLCSWHAKQNAALEEDIVKSLDQSKVDSSTKFFFLNPIHTTWTGAHGVGKPVQGWDILPEVGDPPIFLLETIVVNGAKLLVFYDSGCQTATISERAAAVLDTEVIRPGPSQVSVAGGGFVDIKGGEERFTLPLADGKSRATFTALVMPAVTTEFPTWDLNDARADMEKSWKKDMNGRPMPKLPDSIGGTAVDVMIGIQYMKWFPRILYVLENGLAMHESMLQSADGCRGILGGPHPSFRKAAESSHIIHRVYNQAYDELDVLEHLPVVHDVDHEHGDDPEAVCGGHHCEEHAAPDYALPLHWKVHQVHNFALHETPKEKLLKFLESEEIGTDLTYRCPSCRNCAKCRDGDNLEAISLKSETEQALIESCVSYDPVGKRVSARLPFLCNPEIALKPNMYVATKIFNTQMRLASKDNQVKDDVVKAHAKLVDGGFVCPIDDLPDDVRARVDKLVGYHIPWRTVTKENSLSTPTRMVFDGSSKTPGGESLNAILAKGINTLGNLFNLLIKFRLNRYAFTGDIRMAYNNISMHPDHVAYQKYLWKDQLSESSELKVWVIKSQIYGIRSSGNITIRGFQVLAEHARNSDQNLKLGAEVLSSCAYMDDLISAHPSKQEMDDAAEQLMKVLSLGQMRIKALTQVGVKPDESVSSDGKTVGLLGMTWAPEQDEIALDIKDLYFGKVRRGKRPEPVTGDIAPALKGKFTKRTLLSKAASLYDPIGLLTPFSARLKLDLQQLVRLGLDWDEAVPEVFLQTWVQNLELMQDMRNVVIARTVIPPDAADLNLNYVFSADASKSIAVCTVHTRIKKRDGTYHVSLLCAKSKLTTKLTIPRGELRACLMSASLSFCIRQLSGIRLKDCIYVTDSAICLYWIGMDDRPLTTAVRNQVIEIRRLSEPCYWFHVQSADNVADIGTRTDVDVDYSPTSEWFGGKEWMKLEIQSMPIKTLSELTLNSEEKRQAALETKNPDIMGIVLSALKTHVADRYRHSKYILDPCKYPWQKCLRILALCFRFIDNCKRKTWNRAWFPDETIEHSTNFIPSETELNRAANYYFKIATLEVKKFSRKAQYADSIVKNEIMHYNGRILDSQEVENHLGEALDLSPLSFVKPILDRYSPVSYAVMTYAHVELARHGNSCATLRESRAVAFVIQGRSLAEEVRLNCPFCTRYKARMLERAMAKIHDNRLVVAPPFFYSQVDLFGPLEASCEHQHRAKVKVWGCVFKCTSSCAVAVFCMQDYSTAAFVQTYTRFASRFGHPKKLFIDPGTQLMSACKSMEISSVDLENELTVKHKVGLEFEVCPPGAHHRQGMVERSIREIRKLFVQIFQGLKLSVLSYETAFSFISNELNNFPIGVGSKTENLEKVDLITPNRLIMGRNNREALSGIALIDQSAAKLIQQNRDVQESWWSAWTDKKIADFVPKPSKWQNDWGEISPGDIVIFKKQEHALGSPVFRLARVTEVVIDKDGKTRKVKCQYKNDGEQGYRVVVKDVRQVAVLCSEDRLPLVDALNEASRCANVSYVKLVHAKPS